MKTLLLSAALLINAYHAQTPDHPPEKEQTMKAPTAQSARIIVNHQPFEIELENNPTAQAFAELLPLELSMKDHLGNEKFAALPKSLPSDDKRAGQIHAGDVMLYQGKTLVVFYENFHSNYRYTRIGRITQTDTLQNALGSDGVNVSVESGRLKD